MEGLPLSSPRTVEEVFNDFKGRRIGSIKSLTIDVDKFYQQCDPVKTCLFAMSESDSTVRPPAQSLTTVSWLRFFMDRCKLEKNGSNFTDWNGQLRLAAEGDGKLRYLTEASPTAPNARSTNAVREAYETYQKESAAIKNVLIFSMEPGLQRNAMKMNSAYEIYTRLVTMFSRAPRIVQYEAASQFFDLNIKDGENVGPHVLKIIEHVEVLKKQGIVIPEQLVIDRVLHSLNRIKGFVNFRVNFNMQNITTTLHDLHKMLVQAERDMGYNASTSKDVLNINAKSKGKFKKSGNNGNKPTPSKGKGKAIENSSSKPKKGAATDDTCHYCNGTGHWKRNCSKYLGDIKAGRVLPVGHVKKDKSKQA